MAEQIFSDTEMGLMSQDMRCILDRVKGHAPIAPRSLSALPTIDDDLAKGARLIELRNAIAAAAQGSGVALTPEEHLFLGALDTEMLELFTRLWAQVVAGAERTVAAVQ